MNNQRQSKIALLINMISPARIPLYAGLAASFDLLILHGGTERNRDSWRDVHAMLPGAKIVIEPQPVVLDVGQFIARKGVHLFLRAAARLQKQGLEFSLLLVGSGRDKPATEKLVQELGLKNVHLQASQMPAEMPGIYRS